MPIRKLAPLLINQIAAGEVIERPASVVKELVDNSLDAAAGRIEIVLEDGGRQLIRVIDDGAGIIADELLLAIAPHATSKIDSPDDLAAIGTLGFRGEALASIASISRLRITSRATRAGRAAESAWCIEASGDEMSQAAPAATAPGTSIEVRDLFFNTPARRKFMRAAGTEFGHIHETVTRIAMSNPTVAFSLTHGGRTIIDVPAQSRRQRCIDLLGPELADVLIEFEHVEHNPEPGPTGESSGAGGGGGGGGASVWGLAGMPSIARATTKFQYLYINGRPIRDRSLSHAVKEAYRGLIASDRHPLAVVAIQIDPTAVDVNVHPTKAEVRFHEPSRIHGLVLQGLRQALLGRDLTPSVTLGDASPSIGRAAFVPADAAPAATFKPPAATGQSVSSASAFVDYFKQMEPTQQGFVYQQVKAAMDADATAQDEPQPSPDDAWSQAAANATAGDNLPTVLRDQGILQVHRSYLVTQDEDGLLIVDQHALHERVIYEELLRRVLGGQLESQRLLTPAVVKTSPHQQDLLTQLKPLFDQIGIEVDPIGPQAVGVQAFPTLLFDKHVDPGEFIEALLERVDTGELDLSNPDNREATLHEVLNMMACKAAIKAGDHLTPAELASLLQQRQQIERSSNCPHGRPTSIRLTLRDLAKHFKRT